MERKTDRTDERYLRTALALAEKGRGLVSPNPLVGAVLVKGRTVLAKAHHGEFGGPHAEAAVLEKAGGKARGATLYLNLEPCVHQGKTPPCTDAIIEAGVKRVVFCHQDPNPLVSGKGAAALRRHGVEVATGLLRAEAEDLNAGFLKWVTEHSPAISLKVAMTLDGKIASTSGNSQWISGAESRKFAHELRVKHDAILVGARTVLADDPSLTVRYGWRGPQPARIVLDSDLSLDPAARIFAGRDHARRIIATTRESASRRIKAFEDAGVEVWALPATSEGRVDVRRFAKHAAREGLTSVLVEGGGEVISSFLEARLGDRLYLFLAPRILGQGITWGTSKSPRLVSEGIELQDVKQKRIGDDLFLEGKLEFPRKA